MEKFCLDNYFTSLEQTPERVAHDRGQDVVHSEERASVYADAVIESPVLEQLVSEDVVYELIPAAGEVRDLPAETVTVQSPPDQTRLDRTVDQPAVAAEPPPETVGAPTSHRFSAPDDSTRNSNVVKQVPVVDEAPPPTTDRPRGEMSREEREARRLARLAEHRAATQSAAKPNTKPDVPRPQMSSGSPAVQKPATTKTTPGVEAFDPSGSKPKPLRLRLDSNPEEEETPRPTGRFRRLRHLLGSAHRFYHHCPNCESTEVYGVNNLGEFMIHESERALVYQRLHCERCIFAFVRPGRLLGAPSPKLRPQDIEMYG